MYQNDIKSKILFSPATDLELSTACPKVPKTPPQTHPFSPFVRSISYPFCTHPASFPINISGNDAVTKEERTDNERTLSGHQARPVATIEMQRSALPTSGIAVAAVAFTTRGNGTAPCRESHGRTAPHSAGNSGSTPRNDCSCRSSGACRHRWRYSAAGTLWRTNRNPRRHP